MGNEYYKGRESITVPAEAYNVISVGAMDDKDNEYRIDDELWINEYDRLGSSLGPTRGSKKGEDSAERKKPDLVAPGVDIYTTNTVCSLK